MSLYQDDTLIGSDKSKQGEKEELLSLIQKAPEKKEQKEQKVVNKEIEFEEPKQEKEHGEEEKKLTLSEKITNFIVGWAKYIHTVKGGKPIYRWMVCDTVPIPCLDLNNHYFCENTLGEWLSIFCAFGLLYFLYFMFLFGMLYITGFIITPRYDIFNPVFFNLSNPCLNGTDPRSDGQPFIDCREQFGFKKFNETKLYYLD